ncbi:MAG TPA: ascorbate-dependent monooxygenase [Thermoanaerobaculia bacterium]|nr:ascorbate-dependent monooxygenase [Thermoanaerobaculia bacterium]
MKTFRPLVVVIALFVALTAVARQRAVRHPSAPAGPTFSKEVVRILQDNCQTCHHEGDIAPFPLVTYEDAKPYAQLIKLMTATRRMPPWKPAEGCGTFMDERKLTQQEIDTIGKWADAGAPEGNRAELPAPIDFSSGWALGQPDLILSNAEAYTPPEGTDTYRCFSMPTNLTSTTYVAAVDTHPGDRETVHHVLTFIDTTGQSQKLDEDEAGPGYTCFGGPGLDQVGGTLGGWAPGSRPLEMPPDVAFELPANARIVMQVHYHPHHGTPKADRTEFGVYFAKKEPRATMRILPIVNQTFTIPPHATNYEVRGDFVSSDLPIPLPYPAKIWLVAPHMHLLGKKMTVQMTTPDGQSHCLIDIDDWDFNWQGAYRFTEPVIAPAGTRLWLKAYYDNSSGNPRNPNDPPRAVSWGEQTTDEMALAFVGVTLE